MIVDLLFGKDRLPVAFANDVDVTVIEKPALPLIHDPAQAVARALADGIEADPLEALAARAQTACILICDITRPVPNHLFLRPIIETLSGAGMKADAITVLVATGLHRPNEGAELRALIDDPWVFENARVENHYARDDEAHVDLGVTPGRGTPVKLDRRFVAADLKIATGLVEPHFMAGYSGGRKVVAPGVAHADTIRTFHSARFMEDPRAVQLNLDGNPLHEEQLAIIDMLGDVYAVNTVIDDQRRLSLVNFGAIDASHRAAVTFVETACRVPIDERFRTVVTSAAGYPLDQTYYQTVKGMVTPIDILENDATLIVASDCGEGFGSSAFRQAQERLMAKGTERFLAEILDKTLADIDEWQTEMLLKSTRAARVQLYARGLDAAERAITGVEMIDDVSRAVTANVAATDDRRVAVIPEGPYVVPTFHPPTV